MKEQTKKIEIIFKLVISCLVMMINGFQIGLIRAHFPFSFCLKDSKYQRFLPGEVNSKAHFFLFCLIYEIKKHVLCFFHRLICKCFSPIHFQIDKSIDLRINETKQHLYSRIKLCSFGFNCC